MPFYQVTITGIDNADQHLVLAVNRAQAEKHVLKHRVFSKPLNPTEVADLLIEGVKVERAEP